MIKKITFIILFLNILTLNLLAVSDKDMKIYENNFNKDELLKVKEINNSYYIISSKIDFEEKDNIQQLTLISKAVLFQYLKKKDKKLKSLILKNFQTSFSWKKDKKEYLFSFIKKDNVQLIYIENKKKENKSILYKEIKKLEKIKNKNLLIHKELKSLYFQIADMNNYNIQVDKIMEIKFNEF
jgi:hypothetical protein